MTGVVSRAARLRLGAVFAALLAAFAARAAPSPVVAGHDAGTWDLSFEKGNRRCRLFLRSEPHGEGYALAMPAGCHKAFPVLAGATNWTPGAGEHVVFRDEAGAAVLDFGPDGSPSLSASVGENADQYTLMPINPVLQEALRTAGAEPGDTAQADPAPTAPDGGGVLVERSTARGKATAARGPAVALPSFPPTSVAAVAGNYAVLRQNRDTGCMVTLEPTGRAGGDLRARLAPACRDGGIVVFDPVGWQLLHGTELVLTAKKGHTTVLKRHEDTTWANAPQRGTPLSLKRL